MHMSFSEQFQDNFQNKLINTTSYSACVIYLLPTSSLAYALTSCIFKGN